MEFRPTDSKVLQRFEVFALQEKGSKAFYRITHVFESNVFMMRVSSADRAHDACRPRSFPRSTIQKLLDVGKAQLGTIRLPNELATAWPPGSEEAKASEAAWAAIEPLITAFEDEKNLGRTLAARINARAEKIDLRPQSVRRLTLRYWYFGGVKQCLLSLRRGPKPSLPSVAEGTSVIRVPDTPGKRRGRRPANADRTPPSTWYPSEVDVDDMECAAKRCAALNKHTIRALHEEYLKVEFRKRHREEYRRYKEGEITEPCTARQIRYRLRNRSELSAAVRAAFPSLAKGCSERALRADGPGDIYELDATGGQIVIVDSRDPTRILKRLTIYLLIDRWSRYVVAVYVTLRAPSAEAVRQTLRIAFTSRNSRFKFLNVSVDDDRWPPAVIPLQVAVDNGPDMIAKATIELAVQDLRIECVVLPPYTPDGKAIIERLNRTLKQRMRQRGLPGIYQKFTSNPQDKRSKKRQMLVSCLSLEEVYRELVQIVVEYNNDVHKGLERRLPVLAQHRVANTPQAAYVWGLTHISGRARGTLAPEDYERLTLQTSDAKLRLGVLTLKGGYKFFPANAAAARMALNSNSKGKDMKAKIDKTDPAFLWIVTSEDEWPKWKLDDAGCLRLAAQSMEEREEYAELHTADRTDAKMDATRRSLPDADDETPPMRPSRTPKTKLPDGDVRRRSEEESAALDRGLSGATPVPLAATSNPAKPARSQPTRTAAQFDAEELELIALRESRRVS